MSTFLALSFSVGVPDLTGFLIIYFICAKDNNRAIISDDCACLPEYLDSRKIHLNNKKMAKVFLCACHVVLN